jgi:hypothetical protein
MSDNTYKIKIYYQTGNSFGSEDTSDYIELTWKNLDIAKENLDYIKEHYEMYSDLNGYSYRKKRSNDETIELYKDKPWFVAEYDFCLKLKTDDGQFMQISAFWCGYFEALHEAEIIADTSDMKISFK